MNFSRDVSCIDSIQFVHHIPYCVFVSSENSSFLFCIAHSPDGRTIYTTNHILKERENLLSSFIMAAAKETTKATALCNIKVYLN